MLKAGVIGEYEKICSFSAIGFETAIVHTESEAKEALIEMLKENYCIIYMSTEFFAEVNSTETAVLPLPDNASPIGTDRLDKFAEKAVGSKI